MQWKRFNEYIWELDQQDKRDLIEEARFPYHEDGNFYDDLPVNQSALKAHESGRLESLGLELAYELCKILQDQILIPLYGEKRREAEGELVEVAGRKRRSLDPDFQKILFAPYRTDREHLQEITGESKKNIERYSNLERETIPEEVYRTVLEDLQSRDREVVSPTGHIASSHQAYNPESNLEEAEERIIVEDAGPEDVLKFTEGVLTARNLREITDRRTRKEMKKFNEIYRFIDDSKVETDILKYLKRNEIITEFPNMEGKYFIDRSDRRVQGFIETLDADYEKN